MAWDADDCLRRYRDLVAADPARFVNPPPGEGYEILLDAADIAAAADAVRRQRGDADGDYRVGLLAADPYIVLLREAVTFPDGSLGLYNRVLVPRGVVIVPTLPDGRMLLIERARHGIRRRTHEFPRGIVDPGESLERAAARETMEEVGAEALGMEHLGGIHSSTGCIDEYNAICRVAVALAGAPDRHEGISAVVAVTQAELASMIADGTITDGSTLAAFAQIEAARYAAERAG